MASSATVAWTGERRLAIRRMISRDIIPPWLLTLVRWQCIMTLNMLLERAEGLGSNIAHEHLTDDRGRDPRPNGPPTPGEVFVSNIASKTLRTLKQHIESHDALPSH